MLLSQQTGVKWHNDGSHCCCNNRIIVTACFPCFQFVTLKQIVTARLFRCHLCGVRQFLNTVWNVSAQQSSDIFSKIKSPTMPFMHNNEVEGGRELCHKMKTDFLLQLLCGSSSSLFPVRGRELTSGNSQHAINRA